jgi:diguanylate cyclase (GGDEF)-like protein
MHAGGGVRVNLPPPLPDWGALLDAMPDAAWVADVATRKVAQANAAARTLFDGQPLVGEAADTLIASPEDHAWWVQSGEGSVEALCSETTLLTRSGRTLTVQRSIGVLAGGLQVLVVLTDRSAQRRSEEEREAVLAELQATLEATADGILVTDLVGGVRAFNRRFAEMWDLNAELQLSRDSEAIAQWLHRGVTEPDAYRRRLDALQQAPLLTSVERLTLHNGRVFERVTRPLWARGRPQGRVFSFRDLTASLEADQRIAALASTDALTGLPNRRLLAEAVAAAAARSRRTGEGFALLAIDLDRFRHINDTLGHDTGDRVLVDVAGRIRSCLRSSDQLARIGGDQFALLIEGADARDAETTARRVLAVVAQPCSIEGVDFTLTCSIGVALSPANGHSLDQLIGHAEAAMRQVKDDGRANFRVHQPRAQVDFRRQMALDHAMRQALVSGRFRLQYQPQVALDGGRVVGAEALIRWRDPALGEVPPAQFIPVAEDSGFIVAIGDWVLSQAVRQAALWAERGHPMPIAVNVSALQFQQPQFVDRVSSVLAVSALPPALLELELTESILVRDAEDALHRLQALARLGVRLAIDDFGTGYSNLAYLKRFPIGKLKIDRSFVKDLPAEHSDAGIVRAIVQMARALRMKVVAEGVETEAQREFLMQIGCDEFQGFLFAPAIDSLSFERRLLGGGGDGTRIRLVRG